jgi:hypothetical protein
MSDLKPGHLFDDLPSSTPDEPTVWLAVSY